jgi:hypothetical protein
MREFLKETGLEKAKMSLDADHGNPETMTQIAQAGGLYLIQVQENQPKLLEQCRALAEPSALAETIEHDCAIASLPLDKLICTTCSYRTLLTVGNTAVCKH